MNRADEIDIVVETDGTIRFIYSDEAAELFAGESMDTRRASHVEPVTSMPYAAFNDRHDVPFEPRDGWVADMRPSGGPILGIDEPFATRQAALDAEREWLREHRGL